MNNVSIKISNNINTCMNIGIHNFYNTDKFIYIIFNEVPNSNLVGKFISSLTNNLVEIPIEISSLKKGQKEFKTYFCTVPVVSLYESRVINNWKLFIFCVPYKEPIAKFDITVKINENYINGKPYFLDDLLCGIFLEHRV